VNRKTNQKKFLETASLNSKFFQKIGMTLRSVSSISLFPYTLNFVHPYKIKIVLKK